MSEGIQDTTGLPAKYISEWSVQDPLSLRRQDNDANEANRYKEYGRARVECGMGERVRLRILLSSLGQSTEVHSDGQDAGNTDLVCSKCQ